MKEALCCTISSQVLFVHCSPHPMYTLASHSRLSCTLSLPLPDMANLFVNVYPPSKDRSTNQVCAFPGRGTNPKVTVAEITIR